MNPQEIQSNNTDPMEQQDQIPLSTDDLAAAMGFMTTMGQQQMVPQKETETPEQDMDLEIEDIEDTNNNIKGEFEAFKKEVKSMIKEEIGSLKEMIADSIEEPEENEED